MQERKYNEGVILAVTDWIVDNLDQRLSIDDIAQKSGYSKWYLQKLFARCHPAAIMKPWHVISAKRNWPLVLSS